MLLFFNGILGSGDFFVMNGTSRVYTQRKMGIKIYASIVGFILAAAYIHFASFIAPYVGIVLKPSPPGMGAGWVVEAVNEGGKAIGWPIEPGDRIVSLGGSRKPKLFTEGAETILAKADVIVVEKKDGSRLELTGSAERSDIAQIIFSVIMEAVLLGIGLYAVRTKPESRVIRLFYALNVVMALCILTIFSTEKSFSDIIISFCAIWLPYLLLSFYLLFVFRTIHSRFRKLLLAILFYAIVFSGFLAYLITQGEISKRVENLLNLNMVGALLLLAVVTFAYWKRFGRAERNQLLVLVCGLFLSLLPYTFLYAIPVLTGKGFIVQTKYTLVGLIPFSGTITYLLFVRSMLDMRVYIPRLLAHTLYLGGSFTLFALAARGQPVPAMCLLFALFVVLTCVYQKSLHRFRRKDEQRSEWLARQQLRLSVELTEKQDIRDMMKLMIEAISGRKGEQTDEAPFPAGKERVIEQIRLEAVRMLEGAKLLTETAPIPEEAEERERSMPAVNEQRIQARDIGPYGQVLLEAQESQRIRTSYYLHDHLLQNLIFLSRDLEELHNTGKAEKERIALWLNCLYDSQHGIRMLCDDLYPLIIDQGDLKEALQWLIRTMKEKGDLRVVLDYELAPGEPENDLIKTSLFRAIRELVHNVVKHAQASEMRIRLWKSGQSVHCQILDNGKGFDMMSVFQHASGGERRFGLLSVHSQMRQLGGEVDMDSAPGRGTDVTIIIPLGTEAQARA